MVWAETGGYFDSRGSSSALTMVEDVRGDGYAHTHGKMVPVNSGPSTGGLSENRQNNLLIYLIAT